MSFKDSKLVFLPSSVETVKFLKFANPRTSELQTFVLANDELYETEVYNGDNPHDSKNAMRATTKKDNKSVRSIILENQKDPERGVILEHDEIFVSKKFNFVYVLLSFFENKFPEGMSRYQTKEDLIDLIQEDIPLVNELPENLLNKALVLISDCITEGDEQFYKYTNEKAVQFLKEKVELISKSFPVGIYKSLVKPKINPVDINEDIPPQIEQLAKLKHSIYLLSSYVEAKLSEALLKSFDFEELDTYLAKLEIERKEKRLAEDQINEMNALNNPKKRSAPQAQGARKKQIPKKVVKKGTGALDAFFSKKTK